MVSAVLICERGECAREICAQEAQLARRRASIRVEGARLCAELVAVLAVSDDDEAVNLRRAVS